MPETLTRYVLAALLTVAIAGGARSQNDASYAPLTLPVACGTLGGPVCAKVLPAIGASTARQGLELRPLASDGGPAAIADVCSGRAAAAIVPRDAALRIAGSSTCAGYDIAGRPLFPLYALLIVRAGAPFRELADLTLGPRGPVIATDPDGVFALGWLTGSPPDRTADDFDAVSQLVSNGTLDGFLTERLLAADLLDRVRTRRDARGRPLFAFIDVRPREAPPPADDPARFCLYRVTALDFGGSAPVTTVSTDAVLVLARAWRDAHARGGPRAADALAAAIDAAAPAILAATGSPRDWRPAGASCH